MTGTVATDRVRRAARVSMRAMFVLVLVSAARVADAHDVAAADKAFVQGVTGPAIGPFLYLGAKHMVTGYDHILFLVGVVFYLRRLRQVVLYVSLFTIGHSTTLLLGVLLNIGVDTHLIDAIIGLSVVYKGLDNVGAFRRLGVTIDPRAAVLVFGLFHGLGLATKLMAMSVSRDGLLVNLVSFNIGVEIGQVIALVLVVALLDLWRDTPGFARGATVANLALVAAGLLLTGYQLTRYVAT